MSKSELSGACFLKPVVAYPDVRVKRVGEGRPLLVSYIAEREKTVPSVGCWLEEFIRSALSLDLQTLLRQTGDLRVSTGTDYPWRTCRQSPQPSALQLCL